VNRANRRWPSALLALVALGALAALRGINMLTATRRSVDAYAAYDELELTLESFEYSAPDEPVIVQIRVGNPTDDPLEIESLDLRIAAGVHTVGGGTIREMTLLEPHASTILTVEAAIDDETYVAQLDQQSIEWIINGRILVHLEHGEPTWIPFGTRYMS
jgi:hypothetical protein